MIDDARPDPRPDRPVRRPDPRRRRPAGLPADARAGAPGERRRRASHSLEAVVAEAVRLLDEAGEPALTFRALAARLGGGVGSIYWYVTSREDLLGRAADQVLAGVLERTAHVGDDPDPLADLRALAVAFYDATVDRPWLGSYFLQEPGTQPHGLELFDRLGSQLLRVDLTPRQRFEAVQAVLAYVIGVAADRSQAPPPEVHDGRVDRDEFVAGFRASLESLGPDRLPFLHHVAAEFAAHDDAEVFAAGLDLLLAGIRLQAASGTQGRAARRR